MHRHMDKYIEESIKKYGRNKFFLFDKYFWMSLFEIPLKNEEVHEEKTKNVDDIIDEELTEIDTSVGIENRSDLDVWNG